MVNSKAVAVPYIIAILLGVAVIGLIGYWFFVSTGKLGGESLSLECNTQKLVFCQGGGWKNECGTQPSQTECTQLFGVSGGGSVSTEPSSTERVIRRR